MSRRSNRGGIPSPAAQAQQARALSNLYGNKTTEKDYECVMKQYKDFSVTLYGDDKEVTITDREGRPKKVRRRNPAWKFTREEYDRVMAKAFSWKPGDGMPTDVVEGLQNLDLYWSAIQKLCPDRLKQRLRDHSGIQVSEILDTGGLTALWPRFSDMVLLFVTLFCFNSVTQVSEILDMCCSQLPFLT